ncbi:MAG: CPBP family intramembrane metalloprotease [Caldilineaceae bacterium]|nr:CPBP family intramembrane metalloprotease [Caldilineaceae bacterium]
MNNEGSNNVTRRPFPWRLWGILVAAILVSVILVTPYTLSLQAHTLRNAPLPMPLYLLLPLQWAQTVVLYGIIAALGLIIAGRIGLGLPFLESWLAGRPDWARVRRFLLPAIVVGALAGAAIVLLDIYLFGPRLAAALATTSPADAPTLSAPAWQGFLASFYGGVTEEILLRLFVLSLFAWLGRFVNRTATGRPGLAALWIANIIAAVLFGLGHLPATVAAGLPLDALVITRAIVLNGLGGLAFGWFYWTYGLEAAMVSHFSADLVLHVIMPLLAGR